MLTLWHHDEPAVGVPGASNWHDDRDAPPLAGIARVYVVIEPDAGGEALLERLSHSRLRDQIHVVRLDPFKDVSELH